MFIYLLPPIDASTEVDATQRESNVGGVAERSAGRRRREARAEAREARGTRRGGRRVCLVRLDGRSVESVTVGQVEAYKIEIQKI